MRIVHNSRYIEIPCPDTQYYPYESMSHLLPFLIYYGDKNTFFTQKHDYYGMVQQMLTYDAYDPDLVFDMKNTVIPNIIDRLDFGGIVRCLKNGVKFRDGEKILSFDTIEHLPYNRFKINNDDLSLFKSLKSLDIRGTNISLSFLDEDSFGKHPLNESLECINAEGSGTVSRNLRKLKNLRKLNVNRCNVALEFLVESPCRNTLEELTATGEYTIHMAPFIGLQHLKILKIHECQILFRVGKASLPLFHTLEELEVDRSKTFSDRDLIMFQNLRSLSCNGCLELMMYIFDVTSNRNHPLTESLQKIEGSGSGIIDDGLRHFRNLTSLLVSYSGLSFLANDHPLCGTLKILQMPNKYDSGCLQHLQHLQNLTIHDELQNPLSYLSSLPSHVPSPLIYDTLTHLVIKDSARMTSSITDSDIAHLRVLEVLNLKNIDKITLSFLTADHSLCETLRELTMTKSRVSDIGLSHLRALEVLDLTNNRTITLSFITSNHPLCRSMKIIRACNSVISDDVLHHLSLTKLFIRNIYGITLRHITSTSPLCDTLEELHIKNMKEVTDEGLQHLRSLKKINFDGNSLITFGFMHETHPLNNTLVRIDAGSGLTDASLQYLRVLKILDASSCPSLRMSFITPSHPLCFSLQYVRMSVPMTWEFDRCLRRVKQYSTCFGGKYDFSIRDDFNWDPMWW